MGQCEARHGRNDARCRREGVTRVDGRIVCCRHRAGFVPWVWIADELRDLAQEGRDSLQRERSARVLGA